MFSSLKPFECRHYIRASERGSQTDKTAPIAAIRDCRNCRRAISWQRAILSQSRNCKSPLWSKSIANRREFAMRQRETDRFTILITNVPILSCFALCFYTYILNLAPSPELHCPGAEICSALRIDHFSSFDIAIVMSLVSRHDTFRANKFIQHSSEADVSRHESIFRW